jgi:hypothetical protein
MKVFTLPISTGFTSSSSPGWLVHPYAMWLTSSMLLWPGGGGGESTVCLLHACGVRPTLAALGPLAHSMQALIQSHECLLPPSTPPMCSHLQVIPHAQFQPAVTLLCPNPINSEPLRSDLHGLHGLSLIASIIGIQSFIIGALLVAPILDWALCSELVKPHYVWCICKNWTVTVRSLIH